MSASVINEHTEESIKDYLSQKEKRSNSGQEEDVFDSKSVGSGKSSKSNKGLFLLVLFFVIAAALIAAYFAYTSGQHSFDKRKVKIEVKVPQGIASGEEIAISINYRNDTRVALKDVKLSLFPPQQFIFISSDKKAQKEPAVITWNVGSLSAGAFDSIKLFGKIVGKKGSKYKFDSKISYIPDNFNYTFESADSSSSAETQIISIPFGFSVDAPDSAVSGDEVEYTIDYKNISGHSFRKVEIKALFSDGFQYTSSEPKADKKDENHLLWSFENIENNEGAKLVIRGNIAGKEGERKRAKIVLEASEKDEDPVEYASKEVSIQIKKEPIALSQTINGFSNYSADKGEELEYRIKFKNTSNEEIRGLVINSVLEGNVDFDSLQVVNGSYDDKYKITWSAFNVPKLAVLKPAEEGEVSFRIKVKDYIDVDKTNDKNLTIKNKATISTFNFSSDTVKIEKVIAKSESVVKINASLFLSAKGYFNDDGRIVNKGFIPPEVGKETTYTIHWNLSSLFNDIKNLRIVSSLPDGVEWTGNYIKPNGEISLGGKSNGTLVPLKTKQAAGEEKTTGSNADSSREEIESNSGKGEQLEETQIEEERFYYNPETREVVWEIPQLDANTGISSPVKEVVFQVSIVPQDTDVGNVVKIMDKVRGEGYDEFTGKRIIGLEDELTTELPDDNSIGIEEGIVIPSSE